MKNKVIIGTIILVILIIVYLYFDNDSKRGSTVNYDKDVGLEEKSEEQVVEKVKVDIKGAVKKPGVYETDNNMRVIDVIKLSGGLNKNANTSYINLSAKVKDEMVIWIYTNKEITDLKLAKVSTEYMLKECNCPVVDNTTCLSTTSNDSNGVININTADEAELIKLDGIGETRAKSIIEYRNTKGKFNSINDIKNVTGIGDSAFDKIKDSITV